MLFWVFDVIATVPKNHFNFFFAFQFVTHFSNHHSFLDLFGPRDRTKKFKQKKYGLLSFFGFLVQ